MKGGNGEIYTLFEEVGGDAAVIAMAEEFGGTRLFVPEKIRPDHDIARAIGFDAAKALSAHLAGNFIRVPLARDLRFAHYRLQGLSNGKIARRLGITESGVEKIARR